MTRIDPDDPKWSAYILGELNDAERAAVEAEMDASEEARILVEELRFAAALTRAEFADQPSLEPLTLQQRETIRAAASGKPRRWFGTAPMVWAAGLAAASIALIAVVVPRALRQSGGDNPPTQFAAAIPHSQDSGQPKTPETAAPANRVQGAVPDDSHPSTSKLQAAPALNSVVAAAPAPANPPAGVAEALRKDTAQVPQETGRLEGTVKDASNALIPGASIVATNSQTGVVATAVTGETGNYALKGLQPGTYQVKAELPGFQTNVSDGVQVHAGGSTSNDFKLEVGQSAENVQVSVAAATIQTDSIGQGVINSRLSQEILQGGQGQGQQGQQGQQAFLSPPAASFAPSPALPPAPAPARAAELPAANALRTLDRVSQPADIAAGRGGAGGGRASGDNPFLNVEQNPRSSFSFEAAAPSYADVQRYINQGQLPPKDAVRIEEMINYFPYDYPQPSGTNPIGAVLEVAAAPWNPQHRLVRIGIKAKDSTPVSAKDLELQIEFNPRFAGAYRLIGYENRALLGGSNKDVSGAGTITGGHTMTVFYEVVPAPGPKSASNPMLTVRVRYKGPDAKGFKELTFPLADREQAFARASTDFRFAAAVASFGMILRDSPYKGTATFDSTLKIAEDSRGADRNGYRREFIQTVQRARQISGR